MSFKLSLVAFCLVAACAESVPLSGEPVKETFGEPDDKYMHPSLPKKGRAKYDPEELGPDFWNNHAQDSLREHLARQPITTPAKNVIFFIGDGMSIPTQMAARIYKGQLEGFDGEEQHLSFELFPYTGLSKTYCVDSQVPDSACTATAYLSGVKNNQATIGVTGAVVEADCAAENIPANRLNSIMTWAQVAGKRTGVVTTTRVTHASPAGAYARTSNRDWENDSVVVSAGLDPMVCIDIARQLVTTQPGNLLNVVLGGGRGEFRSANVVDEEGTRGYRLDREDLIELWLADKATAGESASYVWNRDDLLAVNATDTDYLLGLFEAGHCRYHLDIDPVMDPTLAEMVAAAIRILERGPNGFVLFVEGGRIDHAHHDTAAVKALDETVEMSKAVEMALSMTSTADTLIVVSADHAHTMTVNGYPVRGTPIFSAPGTGTDSKPYATLSYANGPGYKVAPDGSRWDLTNDIMTDKNYKFPKGVPLSSETHGGDDVGVYAIGPWAHLFTGVYEQNILPHMMAYASCIGSGESACARKH